MDNWKLKYKKVGHFATMTNWLDMETACSWFDQMEKDLGVTWCELIYTSDDGNELIMDEFVR
jgi:hypothetical protein